MSKDFLKLNYKNQFIAYKQLDFKSNNKVIFFGGYKSNMHGVKASFLDKYCSANKINFTRFDYFGHGSSSGDFHEATISIWLENCLAILNKVVRDPCIIVGSSMGAWLALLTAMKKPKQVLGIIAVAPAPDFTEKLVWDKLSDNEKKSMMKKNIVNYGKEMCGEDFPFTSKLIHDARKHLILDKLIPINCPITLLHGMEDKDVPYEFSLKIAEQVKSKQVTIYIEKNSNHQMSNKDDLFRLKESLQKMRKLVF